jgi:hypothetical protein
VDVDLVVLVIDASVCVARGGRIEKEIKRRAMLPTPKNGVQLPFFPDDISDDGEISAAGFEQDEVAKAIESKLRGGIRKTPYAANNDKQTSQPASSFNFTAMGPDGKTPLSLPPAVLTLIRSMPPHNKKVFVRDGSGQGWTEGGWEWCH